ncbi:MAG: serine/threonine-protein kinase RsbW [Gaiellales bacterium]|jgi:serine/threonine-protein kinase RsbW|nr:serine/threonine-protein kinase RsbW [Gaiellales bacterium]
MAPRHSTDALARVPGAAPFRAPHGSRLPVASRLRLHLRATPADVPFARAAITRLCEHLGIDDQPTEDIRLAVTEACANCACHAYDDSAEFPTYTLDARVDERDLRIVVSDRGMGLESSRASKATSLGYGLGLIQHLARSSHVSARPGGGTRVVMRFPLPS